MNTILNKLDIESNRKLSMTQEMHPHKHTTSKKFPKATQVRIEYSTPIGECTSSKGIW